MACKAKIFTIWPFAEKICPTLKTEQMSVRMKMKPEGTLTATEPVWTLGTIIWLTGGGREQEGTELRKMWASRGWVNPKGEYS